MDFRYLADEGVFSYAFAVAMGASPESLRRAYRRGDITRLHQGWYAPGRPPNDLERHRLRLVALLREYDGRAVARDVSALVRHNLPLEKVDLGVVHLVWRAPGVRFQAYSRTHLHERLPGDWIDDSACAVETSLVVAGDAALRAGTASRERMMAAASALVGQRGITAARGAIRWCDGRHESPGESLAAQLLRGLGYRTVPQLVVDRVEAPGRHDQADLLVEGTRVIVEFDGRGKYDSPGALFAEKRPEDELRRLGYVVVRLTWEDLSRPEQVRRRVQAAIALSGSRTA